LILPRQSNTGSLSTQAPNWERGSLVRLVRLFCGDTKAQQFGRAQISLLPALQSCFDIFIENTCRAIM
jgi:hypothetical protein